MPAFDNQRIYIPRRRPAPAKRTPRFSPPSGLSVSRFASHGLVLSVALGVAFLTGNTFSFIPTNPAPATQLPAWPQQARPAAPGVPVGIDQQYVQKAPVPVTQSAAAIAQAAADVAANKVRDYTIQDGDTIYGLAAKFGVTAQTIVWANSLANADRLALETQIKVPSTSGVLHTVKEGDTLSSIAQKYSATREEILGFKGNEIKDADALALGMEIMVPGGVKPVEAPIRLASAQPSLNPAPRAAAAPLPVAAPPATATGQMTWPTYGPIYSWFSAGHKGLDISPSYGTPVSAADSGVVASTTYDRWGYGYLITVDHGNGYSTWYAHLSEILVSPGQRVGRGEVVGRVGMSGYATGPHLHFEVRAGGVPVNPLNVLPR